MAKFIFSNQKPPFQKKTAQKWSFAMRKYENPIASF